MNKNYLKYYIYNDLFIFLKKILFGGIYFYNIVLLTYYIKYIYILNIILCNFLNFFINKNNNKKLHKKKIKNISYIGTILKRSRIKKKKKYIYDFIICLKKKNVFLTFLDYSKNVLLKNNIGSFGFKKKLKFTGFAIENTSLNFCKKIKKILYLKLRSKLKIM
jgi:ribosomal protein S11